MADPKPDDALPETMTSLKAQLIEARKEAADGHAWAQGEIKRLEALLADLKKQKDEAPAQEPPKRAGGLFSTEHFFG